MKSFSRHALGYIATNTVQKELANTLISSLPTTTYDTIIDLGCGHGTMRQLLTPKKRFIGIDSAFELSTFHPRDAITEVWTCNFDEPETHKRLRSLAPWDLTVSSSALQWSKNLSSLFCLSAECAQWGAFAIFTNQTFCTLLSSIDCPSILPSVRTIKESFHASFDGEIIPFRRTLTFESTYALLQFISRSGLNGGPHYLSAGRLRQLIRDNHLHYLEFDALICIGRSKNLSNLR